MKLWRAADDDYIPDAAAFARHRRDAEQYLTGRSPGFGGLRLWVAQVMPHPARVLDLFDIREPTGFLAEALGIEHPGAIGVEEWIPCDPDVQDALREQGYDWVVVRDSYPEGAEVWLWVGPFVREPELREVHLAARQHLR